MKPQIKKSSTPPQKTTIGTRIVRNIIGILIAFFIILIVKKNPGYDWVYNGLLKGNMQIIQKYKNTTIDQRNEMKLGFSYAYLRFIKNQTPDTAVILMPGSEIFFPKNVKTDFTGDPHNPLWATRFLYPRRIIYDKNRKEQDKITHVAIVNYWGYDKLPYKVDHQEKNTVLPMIYPEANH